MASLAIFNGKGGVGKTTVAVNLSAQAAAAGYRVLLWDVDSQGDSNWILNRPTIAAASARMDEVLNGTASILDKVLPTALAGLSVIPADDNPRTMDTLFTGLARQQRLVRILSDLHLRYDLVVFDCPPGFSDGNLKIMEAADLVVVPTLPSPLAMRGLLRVRDFLARARGNHAPLLPLFSMADGRRILHRRAIEQHPDWPVIPYLSDVERMFATPGPLGELAMQSDAGEIFERLWRGIEARLRRSSLIRMRPADTENSPHPPAIRPRTGTFRPGRLGSVRRIFARPSWPVH